jgi:hypothetical protein
LAFKNERHAPGHKTFVLRRWQLCVARMHQEHTSWN